MAVVFLNNAATTLASNLTSSATSIVVTDGSVLPTLSGSDYTYLTLEAPLTDTREVVKLTARSGNTLTVVRAQDSSSASAFSAGDKCELRITAALLNDLNTEADTESVSRDGDSMTGNLSFGDNNKAIFGASDDLQVYHSGSSSFITDVGTGDLRIRSNKIRMEAPDSQNMIIVTEDAGVQAFYNGTQRLEVTNTGINVTGNVTIPTGNKVAFDTDGLTYISEDIDERLRFWVANTEFMRMTNTTTDEIRLLPYGGTVYTPNLDVTGVITTDGMTTSADINFGDNDKAVFGASSDLQIYHTGSNSFIQDTGVGDLYLATNGDKIILRNTTLGESFFEGTSNGDAKIFYNGLEKLATTSTGIDVTGSVSADGLTVDGDILVNRTSAFTNAAIEAQDDGSGEVLALNNNGTDGQSLRLYNSGTLIGGLGNSTSDVSSLNIYRGSTPAINIKNGSGDISFYDTDGTTASFVYDASAGLTINEAGANRDFRVESDSNTHMLFVDAGSNHVNVGIVAQPQGGALLQVRRNAAAIEWGHQNASAGYFGTLGAYGNNGHPYIGFSTEADTVNANTFSTYGHKGSIIKGDTSGNLIFAQVTDADATTQTPIEVAKISPTEFIVNDASHNRDFRVESNSVSHMLFVDGGQDKVGINISNPGRLLTIQGTSGDNLPLRIMGGANTTAAAVEFQDPTTTADYKVVLGSKGNDLYFQAGGTQKAILKSDGKFGLNQPSPSYALHIGDGDVSQRVHLETSGGGGVFSATDTVNASAYGFRWGHLNGTDRLEAAIGSTQITDWRTTNLYFKPNGQEVLALNTTEVVVNNPSNNTDFRVESDTNSNALVVDAGTSTVGINTSAGNNGLTVAGGSTMTAGWNKSLMMTANFPVLTWGSVAGSGGYSGIAYDASTGEHSWNFWHRGTSEDLSTTARLPFVIRTSEVAINEYSHDTDFRVESNAKTHMLFVDAGNERVAVGTAGDTHTGSGFVVQGRTTLSNGSTTQGSVLLTDAYTPSTNDHLFNIGTHYSSGGPFMSYGLYSDGDANWRSTYDNFSGAHQVLVQSGANLEHYIDMVSNQTAVGNVVTVTKAFESGRNGIIANDGSRHDLDFRIESDSNTHMLFVDAGHNAVGIGNNPVTSSELTVSSGSDTNLVLDGQNYSTWVQDSEWNTLLLGGAYWSGGPKYGVSTRGASQIYMGHDGNATPSAQGFIFSAAPAGTAGASPSFTNLASITRAGTVFNEDSADLDFRVESNNNSNMIFVDAGADQVTIGSNASYGATLGVNGNIRRGSYTNLSTFSSNNDVIAFNYTIPGASSTITPIYSGSANAGGSFIHMGSGGHGTLDFRAAKHGTDSSAFAYTDAGKYLSLDPATKTGGTLIANQDSRDIDFRVESDGNAAMLFVDAANNSVNIGTTGNSGYALNVAGTTRVQNNLKILSTGGANLTQGHLLISSSTTDTPAARGQGVFMFNEGTDTTWYAGTGYNAGGHYHIGFAASSAYTNEGARVTNAHFSLYNEATGAVFNENGLDRDFRVESDYDANALFLDAQDGSLGIGSGIIGRNPADNFTLNGKSQPHYGFNLNPNNVSGSGPTTVPVGMSGYYGISFCSNGVERLAINRLSEVVVNDQSTNFDFRVGSTGYTHAFFVDGGTNNLGIGTTTSWPLNGGGSGTASSGQEIDMQYDGTIWAGSAYWAGGLKTGTCFWTDASGDHYKRSSRYATMHQHNSQAGSQRFYTADGGTNGNVISWKSQLELNRTDAVFNEGGLDRDFRVESVNYANALRVDASADRTTLGKANNGLTNAGHEFGNDGFLYHTRNGDIMWLNRLAAGTAVTLMCNTGTVGTISVNTSGTTYNTTSDRRLKKDIETITDGTDKLMAMNPVTHGWKADPEADAVHGFIAQEMMDIVPEAVSGTPDGEEMMSMDYGRITPVLVAALQDAHKKIAELETRLNELEGK